jgi:phage terminase Nu1 subunit (DNA packaging protein)
MIMANQPKQKPPKRKKRDGSTTLYEEQRRRTAALALREELRNKKLQGELISKELVEREWFKLSRQVRDGLENIASRIAGLVAAERKQDKCFEIIDREIRQALEGLAAES